MFNHAAIWPHEEESEYAEKRKPATGEFWSRSKQPMAAPLEENKATELERESLTLSPLNRSQKSPAQL